MPTPFRLADGVAHQQTLILPAGVKPGKEFACVSELCRREANELVIAYSFDLQTNELRPTKVPNPHAGREHQFQAWRLKGSPTDLVAMRVAQEAMPAEEAEDDRCTNSDL